MSVLTPKDLQGIEKFYQDTNKNPHTLNELKYISQSIENFNKAQQYPSFIPFSSQNNQQMRRNPQVSGEINGQNDFSNQNQNAPDRKK